MKGLQDNGIMANAKHFPGHGDTGVDSHYDLPVIKHSRARMTETELYPFRQLMKDSLMSVMVAHLQVPAFDSAKNTPTTLSKNVVTDLLKGELGFEGLAFTDAMNMQGVAKYYDPGEADVKAGNVDVYAKSFRGLLGQLERDLNRKDINTVIGRLSDFGLKNRANPKWEEMRKVQMKLADENPRACWVNTDDLNGEKHSLHYVRPEGYRKLGERYVEAAKKLIKDNHK